MVSGKITARLELAEPGEFKSEQVSIEYLAYLDGKDISYVVTRKDHINLVRATEILKETFGIERLGVVGGPTINTAFWTRACWTK